MDEAMLSEILNVIIIPAAAFLAVKLKKYKPLLEEAISDKNEATNIAEDVYGKSRAVIPLFDQLETITTDLEAAIADKEIDPEETAKLIADARGILENPVVSELRETIKGYTCSGQ